MPLQLFTFEIRKKRKYIKYLMKSPESSLVFLKKKIILIKFYLDDQCDSTLCVYHFKYENILYT